MTIVAGIFDTCIYKRKTMLVVGVVAFGVRRGEKKSGQSRGQRADGTPFFHFFVVGLAAPPQTMIDNETTQLNKTIKNENKNKN